MEELSKRARGIGRIKVPTIRLIIYHKGPFSAMQIAMIQKTLRLCTNDLGLALSKRDRTKGCEGLQRLARAIQVCRAALEIFSSMAPSGSPVSDPNDYVFWDGYHPTTSVHFIAAEFIDKALFLRRHFHGFLSVR